jgi:hypothetical protein
LCKALTYLKDGSGTEIIDGFKPNPKYNQHPLAKKYQRIPILMVFEMLQLIRAHLRSAQTPGSLADPNEFPRTSDTLFRLFPEQAARDAQSALLVTYFTSCIIYYDNIFFSNGCLFEHLMEVYRLARIISPTFAAVEGCLEHVKALGTIKGFTPSFVRRLVQEWPMYEAAAKGWVNKNPEVTYFLRVDSIIVSRD